MNIRSIVGALRGTLCLLALGGWSSAAAQTPQWLTCPDAVQLDLRPDRDRDPLRIREIAPSAGARTSSELSELGALQRLAYDLYDTYDAGGDLRARFAPSGLKLLGFIYGDPGPDTERRLPRPRDRDTRTFYGFIADDPATNHRVIVFRGTLQPSEWVRNLQVRQRPFAANTPNARVHSGFMAIFESLELEENGAVSPFAAALPRLTAPQETVFVGHSLGSAIATLAGVAAAQRAPARARQMRIVTFASPRVGDAGFSALAAAVGRIDRICNKVDVVTAVPPSTLPATYVHVGRVFPLSSFDWPSLDNTIEKAGDQVLCWHSDQSYAYMLAPDKTRVKMSACTK